MTRHCLCLLFSLPHSTTPLDQVPLKELPPLMNALGYYLSAEEASNLIDEVSDYDGPASVGQVFLGLPLS